MKRNPVLKKGMKWILCATALFFILVVLVHSIFVDMGLKSIEKAGRETIPYVKEQLEIYGKYQEAASSNGEKSAENEITLESIFSGMRIRYSGILIISDGNEVIASNAEDVFGKEAGEWDALYEESSKVSDNFGKVQYNGKRWYICKAEYENYTLYILFISSAVYQYYYLATLIMVIFYLLIMGVVLTVYNNLERKNYKKLKESYQTIAAINEAYTADILVSVKDGKYEWLKGPDAMLDKTKAASGIKDVMKILADAYVQENYHQEYLEFTDIQTVKERLQGNKKSVSFTYEDKNDCWITISIVVQEQDEHQDPVRVLYLFSNVTAEMKKEKEYQKQLKLAGDAKTNFLRRMSHDIRTPINGIRGIIEIADKNPTDLQRQQECREKVMVASGYLLDLVNNVLDMSKLESGEVKLEHKSFNLLEMLARICEIVHTQCNECGITFYMEKGEMDHVNVLGSPVHLQQVLLNIIGNAVKYNKENGSITVAARELSHTQDQVEYLFICRDTGIGMSEEFQKHIFEPFSQENENGRSKYAGTGLGMAIVKELLDLQGGTIFLKSQPGEGTEFRIYMTFEIDHSEGAKEELTDWQTDSMKGIHILLVEDNELNMEVAEYFLQEQGAQITKAWNGQQAVELFSKSENGYYDLILMDVMMPVMGGLEATRQIRKLSREDAATVPIVAMTANAFQDDIERSLEAGMNAHITKPLDMKVLMKTVGRVLKRI